MDHLYPYLSIWRLINVRVRRSTRATNSEGSASEPWLFGGISSCFTSSSMALSMLAAMPRSFPLAGCNSTMVSPLRLFLGAETRHEAAVCTIWDLLQLYANGVFTPAT